MMQCNPMCFFEDNLVDYFPILCNLEDLVKPQKRFYLIQDKNPYLINLYQYADVSCFCLVFLLVDEANNYSIYFFIIEALLIPIA